MSCTFAVFLDPLYRYIPVVIEDRTCFHGEARMVWTFFGLRSAVDLFYAMDIAIFWRRRNYTNAKAFEARIHKLLPYLPRMFVALPLPQEQFMFLLFFSICT
ncbi:unnamed protein product [Prunus armeniaca]|uniref:Uncharacterized protein n=1 Tax=Prunus armeniaca TaxID=36596 RepID=A0A6J5VJ84_PRUAR|nr:unnamed protein product [Prunus armeniaca]